MALQSKTITGSTSSSLWTYKLVVTENSTNISNNTSSVTVVAYLGRASSRSYIGTTWSGSITVNGSSQSMSGTIPYPTYIDGGAWYQLASKTFTVSHNNDGSKTTSISSSWSPESGVTPSSASASGTMTLTKIPRQANINSAPNFNDEANPTITYTNSAGNSVDSLQACISLTGSADDINYRNISKTGSSYTFNLTTTERNVLRSATSSNSRSVYFYVKTVIGSNTYYSRLQKTLTIINANPTFSNFVFKDINPITLNLTDDENTFIKGYSNLEATISITNKAVANKQATMSYYQILSTKVNYSSNSDVVLTLNKYKDNNVEASAVDSRGNTTKVSKIINSFIEYFDITKGNITLSRSDNGVGKFVTLKFNGTFWNDDFGNVQNELEIIYKYKKTTDSTYTVGTSTITPTISNNLFSFEGLIEGDTTDRGFVVNESYDVVVTVSDKLSTVDFVTILPSGEPAIAVYKNKVSLGAKYDTSLGGTQLWGYIYLDGNKLYSGEVIYTNNSDIAGNITFDVDTSQYEYLEIMYGRLTHGYPSASVKLMKYNNKFEGILSMIYGYTTGGSPSIAIVSAWAEITGQNLIYDTNRSIVKDIVNATITSQKVNQIVIYKVIGYK